jgi:hypothetical protein
MGVAAFTINRKRPDFLLYIVSEFEGIFIQLVVLQSFGIDGIVLANFSRTKYNKHENERQANPREFNEEQQADAGRYIYHQRGYILL